MAYTMMSLQELLEESDFPNRTHFQSDRVYVSPDAQKVLSILDLSSQERKSVCLFEGPEGTGKTATVRAIGYELRNRGWRVFHVDIRDLVLDPDSPVKIARLVLKDFDHQRTLVIVENVHKDTERAKPIISASTAARTASFLFTQHPPSPREELTYGGELYPLTITTIFTATTPTALQGVLRKYVTARKGEDRFSDAEAVLREAEADIEKLHGQASLNLRDFFLFLEQWDPSREKLLELATSHVPSAYATKVSQLSFELKQVLLLISALATIEIEVHKDALDGTALSQLISHKLVNRRVDFVSLNHPSEARYILQILQPDPMKRSATLADQIAHYIVSKPLNIRSLLGAISSYALRRQVWKEQSVRQALESQLYNTQKVDELWSILKFISDSDNKLGKTLWRNLRSMCISADAVNRMRPSYLAGSVAGLLRLVQKIEPADARQLVHLLGEEFFADMALSQPFYVFAEASEALSHIESSMLPTIVHSVGLEKLVRRAQEQGVGLGAILRVIGSLKSDPALRASFVHGLSRELWVQKLQTSSVDLVQDAFTFLEACDSTQAESVRSALRPAWKRIWLESNFASIAKRMQLFIKQGDAAKQAMSSQLLAELSALDLASRIASSTLNGLGRLLAVAERVHPQAGAALAIQFAVNADFSGSWSAEEFTLLATHIGRLAPDRVPAFIRRTLPWLDVEKFLTEQRGAQLGRLIKMMYRCYEQTKDTLVLSSCGSVLDKVFQTKPNSFVDNINLASLNGILFYGERINKDSMRSWISPIDVPGWIQILAKGDAENRFPLLWNLYWLNQTIATALVKQGAKTIADTIGPKPTDLGKVALLGLTRFLAPSEVYECLIPESVNIPEFTGRDFHVIELMVFAAFALKQKNLQRSESFLAESNRRLQEVFSDTLIPLLRSRPDNPRSGLLLDLVERIYSVGATGLAEASKV